MPFSLLRPQAFPDMVLLKRIWEGSLCFAHMHAIRLSIGETTFVGSAISDNR